MTTQISGSTGIDKVQDGTITDADINASAAIAGSKVDVDVPVPVVHYYRIADIPSTASNSTYFTFTFTITKDCRTLINAQATVRQNYSTHDYAYLIIDGNTMAEASVSDRNHGWATNHAFAGIWYDFTAGTYDISIKNSGGNTSYGANDTNYDGWVTVQEIS